MRGGSASVYANLASHLGRQLTVLAPTVDYLEGLRLIGWREHDRRAGYRIIRLPLLRTTMATRFDGRQKWVARLGDLWLRARVLSQVARVIAFDRVRVVCLGEVISLGWLAPVLRLLPGVRSILYIHGEEITTLVPNSPEWRRAERTLRMSNKTFVVSGFTKAAIRTMFGDAIASRVTLLQNGVDVARFTPGAKPEDLRQSLNLGDAFVFVCVSRLVDRKGHDYLIRAFAGVVARFPDTRLLIVGTGPSRTRLGEISVELGLSDTVIFAGAVSDERLVDHYRLGDAFVMPNRTMADGDTEGFGLVFLEANGCGVPVIAGKDGGSTEAVDHGYNGLVVDGHSVQDIEQAMLTLRADPALREQLRANGLTRAAASDWSTKAHQFKAAAGAL